MRLKRLNRFLFKNINIIIPLLLLIPIFFILYKLYIPRVNAFGCFDDCFNFMGGYFILQGKNLFSEIFFNHQPLAAYLSYFVQLVTSPENIFELVLRHRQFVLFFSFIFNLVLIFRFGLKFILFTIIFEFSKYYLFGDRYLGESMVVYPFVYLGGLVFLKLTKQKIYTTDYFLASLFCWFIVFMREPYILAVLFAYLFFVLDWPLKTMAKASLVLFTVFSFPTIFAHKISEYMFNVIVFNYQAILHIEGESGMLGPKIIQWFFYPLYIFFNGPSNIFKTMLIGVNIVFLILLVSLVRSKKYILSIFIFILLGLANIRIVEPGTLFYSAFHMIPWFGFFLFTTVFLLSRKYLNKLIFYLCFFILSVSYLNFILSPSYFAKEKIDTHSEFITNYGNILQEGEVIRAFSNPRDTLFLDASDDLIYWQAKLPSSYLYSWYTSAMPNFKKYTDARREMFEKNPPTFYREYGSCPKKSEMNEFYRLPDFIRDQYVRLYSLERPSCIFVRKDKIEKITDEQWKKAKEFLYAMPPQEEIQD